MLKAFLKGSGVTIWPSPAHNDDINYIVLCPFDFDLVLFNSLNLLLIQDSQECQEPIDTLTIFHAVNIQG